VEELHKRSASKAQLQFLGYPDFSWRLPQARHLGDCEKGGKGMRQVKLPDNYDNG